MFHPNGTAVLAIIGFVLMVQPTAVLFLGNHEEVCDAVFLSDAGNKRQPFFCAYVPVF